MKGLTRKLWEMKNGEDEQRSERARGGGGSGRGEGKREARRKHCEAEGGMVGRREIGRSDGGSDGGPTRAGGEGERRGRPTINHTAGLEVWGRTGDLPRGKSIVT